MFPAIAKFIFPSSNESPSKIEDDSEQLKVITEPYLHDDTESVQSSATLNTSGYSSMKKDDLVALATRVGVRLDKKATKTQIIKLLATTSVGTNQSTSISGEQEVEGDSVVSQDVIASTPLHTRGRLTASSRTSELPDVSANSSPLRTRSSTSKLSSQVRTPATAKSSRIKHELRSPKELRVSHKKALDPQFEYYSAVETIDVNVRMTRSAKKAKSGTRTTPIKRKRSSSISERSASKTTTYASADESEAEQPALQTRRTSRRSTVSRIESPSTTVKDTTQRHKSSVEPTTKSNASEQRPTSGLKRRQTTDLPVSKRSKKVFPSSTPAPVDNGSVDESTRGDIQNMNDGQQGAFETVEEISHNIAAEENRQMEQDIFDSLKDTHVQPKGEDSEEDSNNSDNEVDIQSMEDYQAIDSNYQVEADQDMMVEDEEDDDDDEENENSDEEDEDESSNDSEESDSNEDEDDGSDDSEEGEEEDEGDGGDYIAPVTYNVPPNSFMAAFLAAGKKTVDAMTNEVMDLVSDNDKERKDGEEKKYKETQPAKVVTEKSISQFPSFVPTTVPEFPAFSFASTVPAAVNATENSENKNANANKENSITVHPALEAFNKLGSKLITAAVAAETTNNVSGVEKLSAQEYDLIKSILSKIKPPEVIDQSEDNVNAGQKRALPNNTEGLANDDSELIGSHGQESAIKRRRTSTDSRVSYDGGESWNLSHPSGEDPLSPSFNTYPTPRSSIGGVFGRSSFGGGLFGRVQTPYHHNFRASISSNSGEVSAAVSASKAMFDRRIEDAATSLPPPVASTVDIPAAKKSTGVTFNLGSSAAINGSSSNSASKVFGSGGRSSYIPQFRSSAASFVPAVSASATSRDTSLSLLCAEESSMSYLEKRRQQRQLQTSASATVAKQILDTLGSLSSPIDKQSAPVGLLTQEANVLKFGSFNVPDFQSKLNASQSSSTASGNGASSDKSKPSVTFASTVVSSVTTNATASAPKVSFALSTKEDDENTSAKSNKFFAPPTPMPLSSFSSSDRHVKFAADTNSKPSVSLMTPASKTSSAVQFSNDHNNDDSFNLADDEDQVIVVEKKRSSIGSTPFKSSLTSSSSMDADEFSFDEPMIVKGVDNDFVGRENIADIRYAFTPPSKPKRSRLATPAAKKVNNKPIIDSLKKDSALSTPAISSTTPNIWNLKPNPNEKKCQVCLVMNDKVATICESCGSVFPATTGIPAASSTPAPVTNIWNMKPNPNEKKCQVCLVMNDKSATKCESCGSAFHDTSASSTGTSSTGTSSSSSATAPTAFSASSAAPKTAPPAVSGFTFGVTPSSATAPVATGASFSFDVPNPAASESEASKAAPSVAPSAAPVSLPKLDSKATFTGFSFGATPAASAAAGITINKVDAAKDETSTAAPAISFGIPKTDSSKFESSTTIASIPAKSVPFSGGFSLGAPSSAALPTIPENKSMSPKEEQEDTQPTRKRRVEEDEHDKTDPAPFNPAASISFGAPSVAAVSAAPKPSPVFGLPAPASSSSSATEEKKQDDASRSKPFGVISTGSFSFGAPAASSTADAGSKPLFGAPAGPVVATTALPSFSTFASQSSSSSSSTTTSVTAPVATTASGTTTSTAAPAFGASYGALSSSAATLPPLGSSSSAPFNAFAPTATAVPAAAPITSSSTSYSSNVPSALPAFGAPAVPITGSSPFGAFGSTAASKPPVDSKTSNPFGNIGSSAPAAPVVPVTTAPAAPVAAAASNPFASAFNASAPAAAKPAVTFPPATASSNPFGATAAKQPFGNTTAASAPAPSSNPFAPSFGASAVPTSAPVSAAMFGAFGAPAASTAANGNPFASSFSSSASASTGPTMFGIPTGPAPSSTSTSSNPFANSFGGASTTASIPSLTPSSSTNNFSFGAGAGGGGVGMGGMGGFPAAPSLTPQTSFSAPTNNFPSQPVNNMFGGTTGGSLPSNPMMPSGGGVGFSLGAGGAPSGGAGGNGQPRKILKIKKKV